MARRGVIKLLRYYLHTVCIPNDRGVINNPDRRRRQILFLARCCAGLNFSIILYVRLRSISFDSVRFRSQQRSFSCVRKKALINDFYFGHRRKPGITRGISVCVQAHFSIFASVFQILLRKIYTEFNFLFIRSMYRTVRDFPVQSSA